MTNVGEGRPRARVLIAALVYNGRSFVPDAITSFARLCRRSDGPDVDVIVFDDASPEPGWSDELAALCGEAGVVHYRSPRNLGIPRNMNLGLLHAEQHGYDYVVIANSDVLVAANLASSLVAAAEAAQRCGISVGSITAWSNNASIYSLPTDDAALLFSDPGVLDWTADTVAGEFGDQPIVVPTGVGYMMCIPTAAITEVGLFDPVFGRGYCEEVDWCCRATRAGRTHLLATNTFAYHIGSASTRLAGLLAPGEQTVHTHELIIDDRYPDYRDQVAAWSGAGGVQEAVARGTRALVTRLAAEHGWVLEATWLRRAQRKAILPGDGPGDGRPGAASPGVDRRVRILIQPDGPSPMVEAVGLGWRHPIDVDSGGILASVARFLGVAASEVRIDDSGTHAAAVRAEAIAAGIALTEHARYPERV